MADRLNAYELNSAKHDYVSPSDNILSPCTKKLAVYKGRQFMKCVPFFFFPLSLSRELLFPSGLQSINHHFPVIFSPSYIQPFLPFCGGKGADWVFWVR
jgi:hypothetical protein